VRNVLHENHSPPTEATNTSDLNLFSINASLGSAEEISARASWPKLPSDRYPARDLSSQVFVHNPRPPSFVQAAASRSAVKKRLENVC